MKKILYYIIGVGLTGWFGFLVLYALILGLQGNDTWFYIGERSVPLIIGVLFIWRARKAQHRQVTVSK